MKREEEHDVGEAVTPDSPMMDLEEEMEEWPFRMGGGGGGGPAGVREEEEDETEEEEEGGGGLLTRMWGSEVTELWTRYGGGGGGASRPPLRDPRGGTWGAVWTTHTHTHDQMTFRLLFTL